MDLVLPCDPQAAAMARAALAPLDAETDERLLTIVTEVVTNAVRHGGGEVRLSARRTPGTIRIEVRDGGEGFDGAEKLAIEATAAGGFGLKIVDHISDRWGAGPGVVWFELDVS